MTMPPGTLPARDNGANDPVTICRPKMEPIPKNSLTTPSTTKTKAKPKPCPQALRSSSPKPRLSPPAWSSSSSTARRGRKIPRLATRPGFLPSSRLYTATTSKMSTSIRTASLAFSGTWGANTQLTMAAATSRIAAIIPRAKPFMAVVVTATAGTSPRASTNTGFFVNRPSHNCFILLALLYPQGITHRIFQCLADERGAAHRLNRPLRLDDRGNQVFEGRIGDEGGLLRLHNLNVCDLTTFNSDVDHQLTAEAVGATPVRAVFHQ